MTIVEEIDKKSNRPHRSKNIVDAMKYANNIASTPQNIAEAVKKSQSSGGGGAFGLQTARIQVTVKSLPGGATLEGLFCIWYIYDSDHNEYLSSGTQSSINWQVEDSSIELPVKDGFSTEAFFVGNSGNLVPSTNSLEASGNIEVIENGFHVAGDGSVAFDLEWYD